MTGGNLTGFINFDRLNGTLLNISSNISQILNETAALLQGYKKAGFSVWSAYAPCCEQGPNYDPFADKSDCMNYPDVCSKPGFFTAQMVGQ
jgi:hypothetical protein